MVITNLTLIFWSDLRAVLCGLQVCHILGIWKRWYFYGVKNRVFFFYTKHRSIQNRIHAYVNIQLVKGYQNHHHMSLLDLPFVKKWGSKNSLFQFFDILRVLPGPYEMESSIDAYVMIEEVLLAIYSALALI
jgi:hypothetical protein